MPSSSSRLFTRHEISRRGQPPALLITAIKYRQSNIRSVGANLHNQFRLQFRSQNKPTTNWSIYHPYLISACIGGIGLEYSANFSFEIRNVDSTLSFFRYKASFLIEAPLQVIRYIIIVDATTFLDYKTRSYVK